MKTKLFGTWILSLAFSAFPLSALATGLGLEAGMNFSNLSGGDAGGFIDSRVGFVGGGFLNLTLTPALALQPEVLYSQKGGAHGTTIYEADYLEIPILLEISLGTGEVNPGILLGPTFS